MPHFFYIILTILAVIFGIYFGIMQGETLGIVLGIVFFFFGTIPWILFLIEENKDKK